MTARFFADTNLLVYARDNSEPEKQVRAKEWMEYLWRTAGGRVSLQVLNEYYWVVTRKLSVRLKVEQAREEIRDLFAWEPVSLSDDLARQAWGIEDRFQLAYWDALIVAASKVAGCQYLLTEDLQTGQNLDGIVVVDPLQAAPGDVT